MKTKFYRSILFLLTAFSLFLLFGCSNNPANSEKDSNKTNEDANTAGQLVMESFKETDSLAQFIEVAKSGLAALSFENEMPISEVSKLAKKKLSKTTNKEDLGASMTIDFDDTSSGKLYIIFSTTTNLVSSSDTLVVKWDEYAKNDIQNDENVISISGEKNYSYGKKVQYAITDLDNDDVLLGQTQYNGKERITYHSTLDNITEKIVLDASSGIDKNFGTDEDNQILALSWEKFIGGKISAKATFEDADQDGILIDKGKEVSSVIDVTLQVKNPPLQPFVDSILLKIRVLTKGNG
ncbi:MAG: hypothetical protein N2053_02370, partial [Chitinispirillaceae bacterium]|nr:hypothetical protein [Chitinispirillaceae bacterium]